MRKDLFIVGARLLGILLLADTLVPIVNLIGYWTKYMDLSEYNLKYLLIMLLTHLAAGIYLIGRAHKLYNFLNRFLPDPEETKEADEVE